MAQKTKVLGLIEWGRIEMLRFADTLSEAERTTSGTPEQWAIRDELSHAAEWIKRWAAQLAEARQGQTPIVDNNYAATSRIIFDSYRACSWQAIMALIEQAYQNLLDEVQALTEEALNDPQHYAWMEGTPVWEHCVGYACGHPFSHLISGYWKRGSCGHAIQLAQMAAEQNLQVDDNPKWQGSSLYNLACHYAQYGLPQQALEALDRALRLKPTLVEWSQEDSDLAALRGMPEFQEIIDRYAK